MSPQRLDILGVGVSAINMGQALGQFDQWIREGEKKFVCVTTVHGLIESQRDSKLRDIHNRAGLVTPDGMPLVWLLKHGGHRHADRVYGPDLMLNVFKTSSERSYSHFLYGASESTLKKLRSNLEQRFPGARITGSHSPPFRPLTAEEDEQIVREINESGADIVWVGLSTPKQERWMAAHRSRLDASVLVGVGAAFDFHAGATRQAPHFIQRAGLEWAFRLAMEPRRLWKRYLGVIPPFLLLVLFQKIGIRRYSAFIGSNND